MASRFLLVALAAVLAGCDLSGRVEGEIEAALPRAIGPAESYEATVEGLRARSGEADVVRIVGRRVRPEGSPTLDRLDLDLRGVRYDRGDRRIERAERATGRVRVLPADLAAFLEARDDIAEASVALRPPAAATVRLRPDLTDVALLRGVTAEVRGTLRPDSGRVYLDVTSVRAAGIGLGGTVARALGDRINPVVDLGDRGPDLRVTRLAVEDGALVLDAEADVDGLRLR